MVLRQRGEDISKRASNSSDYLLAGVLTCFRCGHRYVGGAAHGRSACYRYYRCFTRQRYGISRCDADALPADALEAAVIESLSAT
jgi:site-specific DNA recombinase